MIDKIIQSKISPVPDQSTLSFLRQSEPQNMLPASKYEHKQAWEDAFTFYSPFSTLENREKGKEVHVK